MRSLQELPALEIPEHADVVVDTAEMDVETCVNHILEQLKSLLRESV